MKKIFSLIPLIVLFVACKSSKNNVLPPTVVTVNNSDSVHKEYIEILRVDTVTVFIEVPVETTRQIVNDSTSHLETKFAESDAWINVDGSLGHSLKNKPQTIPTEVEVRGKDTQSNVSSESVREVPVPYPEYIEVERDFTLWEKFRLKSFWVLLGLEIISSLWIFRKPISKIFK